MIRKHRVFFVLALCLLGSQSLSAQSITIEQVRAAWGKMSDMVVESAKLMPAEHFDFTPGDPLRDFAAQLNHTTRSTIGFSYSVNAGRLDFKVDPKNPPQDKAGVIDLLEKSFAHFAKGLDNLSTEDLEQTVPWGPRGNQRQITRLKAILIVTSHLQREHGKTMMYLRAKGIQPAPAGSW